MSTLITEPGVYPDLSPADYHAQHDWLSATGSKRLIWPSCPAKFKAGQGVEERKRHFDLGKVVHRLVLGKGDQYEVVLCKGRDGTERAATGYELVSARAHRDAIYDAGKVPILAHELTQAEAMAASVKATPEGAALFGGGLPEVALFWVDEETGVKCRALLDYLPERPEGRRLIVPDLKTAATAEPGKFARAAADFGYVEQQVHYIDGLKACGIDPDPAFVFVVVEKDRPHVVTVGQFIKPDDLKLARRRIDQARRIFRQCLETDHWPSYTSGVVELELPAWHHYAAEESLTA